MIPWTVGQQFQDPEFPLLSGARIVRIAVHSELSRAGYGSRAVQLLRKYYQGELASLADEEEELDDADDDAQLERANGNPGGPSSSGEAFVHTEDQKIICNIAAHRRRLSRRQQTVFGKSCSYCLDDEGHRTRGLEVTWSIKSGWIRGPDVQATCTRKPCGQGQVCRLCCRA